MHVSYWETMNPKNQENYDVIIIGAGISGLVCGCYLAKGGLKVLIIEKNDHPGGCCTSFSRNGFQFDSAAHSLGGMSPKGPIGSVLSELGIENFQCHRTQPSYRLKVSDYTVDLYNNFKETIDILKRDFKKEANNLDDFFNFIHSASLVALIRLKKKTFREFLGEYFDDEKL